jgi:hypothetical protein
VLLPRPLRPQNCESRARIFKLLRSPGIHFKESILTAYVARAWMCKRFRSPGIDSKEQIPLANVAWLLFLPFDFNIKCYEQNSFRPPYSFTHTVGAQSTACAQSIAHSHIGDSICKKKLKFWKIIFTGDKKGNSAAHSWKKKITFLALKVENSHVPKKLFLFL